MIKPIFGLIFGILLGCIVPLNIPVAYSKLFTVALITSLDAVFGGLKAASIGKFEDKVFISGFAANTMLAAALVFIGERLGIDLYYVALLTFGFRIFKNLAILRRKILF